MEKYAQLYDSTLLSIMEEFASNGKYVLKNDKGTVRIFNVNSLLYIPINDFIKMAEEIMNVTVPESAIDFIYKKFYVENVENFISNISHAICTNFLDGRSFEELRNFSLENGGKKINTCKTEDNLGLFSINDMVLYKNIINDDDFLLKEISKYRENHISNNTVNNMKKNLTNHQLNNYSNIQRNNKTIYQNIDTKKIFNLQTKFDNDEIFQPEEDIYMKNFNHYRSKPRGKQMTSIERDLSQRPFRCTYPGCNRAYKRFEHLKRHNKMHTGEKPFVCKFPGCNRFFSRSDNLTAHYKIHNISAKQIKELSMISKKTQKTLK